MQGTFWPARLRSVFPPRADVCAGAAERDRAHLDGPVWDQRQNWLVPLCCLYRREPNQALGRRWPVELAGWHADITMGLSAWGLRAVSRRSGLFPRSKNTHVGLIRESKWAFSGECELLSVSLCGLTYPGGRPKTAGIGGGKSQQPLNAWHSEDGKNKNEERKRKQVQMV